MARPEKRSRVKGIPPRVRVLLDPTLTGSSVPPVPRTNTQGQNSGSDPQWFDDGRTMTFGPVPKGRRYLWGSLLVSGSRYAVNDEVYTSMSVATTDPVGSLVKGISDSWLPPSPGGPRDAGWTPFLEHNLHASDGKSQNDVWFATGSLVSEVGEGFSQPLWSKTKVEVRMPLHVSLSLYHRSGSGEDRSLAYYDWGRGAFQVLGPTKRMDEYYQNVIDGASTFGLYFREKCVAFGPSVNSRSASIPEIRNYGTPVHAWGFPWHQKWLPPSQSLSLSLTGSLTGPFLLEKVVLTFSGAYNLGTYPSGSDGFLGQSTWFVLAYHKVGKVAVSESVTVPGTVTATPNITAFSPGYQHGLGNLTLVTHLQVSTTSPGSSSQVATLEYDRELVVSSSRAGWVGSQRVLGTVKVPGKYPSAGILYLPTSGSTGGTGNPVNYTSHRLSSPHSGRTGLTLAQGRNYLEQLSGIGETDTQVFDNTTLRWSRNPYRTNPCWLLPEDNLVFGVQVPFPGDWRGFGIGGATLGPNLTLPAGSTVQVTLYGSYVRDDQESHDLGSGVSSVVVREPITGRGSL